MCHVIRVYTFCPSWVCGDPGGKGGGGGGDVWLRRHVWLLSLGDEWAVVSPPTSPDSPRCSRTSCGQSSQQARETQSHSMINHHTRCCMQLGSHWPPAEWLAAAKHPLYQQTILTNRGVQKEQSNRRICQRTRLRVLLLLHKLTRIGTVRLLSLFWYWSWTDVLIQDSYLSVGSHD